MEKSVEKNRISVGRECFIKDYLWRNIEVGTLYFFANSRLTTPRFIAFKNQNIVNLPESIPARRVVVCMDIRSLLFIKQVFFRDEFRMKRVTFCHMRTKRTSMPAHVCRSTHGVQRKMVLVVIFKMSNIVKLKVLALLLLYLTYCTIRGLYFPFLNC